MSIEVPVTRGDYILATSLAVNNHLTQEEVIQILTQFQNMPDADVLAHLGSMKIDSPRSFDSLIATTEFTTYFRSKNLGFTTSFDLLPEAHVLAVPQMPLNMRPGAELRGMPSTQPDPRLEQTPPVVVDTPAGPGPLPAPVSDMVEAVQAVVEEELPTWFWLLIGVKAALILFFVYTVFYRKKSVSY